MENEEEGLRRVFGKDLFIIGVERCVDDSLIGDPTQSYYPFIKKDLIIRNNGTMDDLKREVYRIDRCYRTL